MRTGPSDASDIVADARTSTNAGVGPAFTRDVLIANLKSAAVVAHRAAATDRPGVALWHGLGCDAGADLRPRWCLPIA